MNFLCIKNNFFKIFIELFVFDKKARAKLKAKWAKFHLKKYLFLSEIKESSNEKPKIIWQYWHQGENNAPEIIKKCLNSVKKYHPDYAVNVLSFDDIKNYVDIPQRYYQLLENNKMKIAHFSDILRLYLLSKYGGTWIDSTIFLSDRIPDDILNSDFFTFQKNPQIDDSENKMSCFFLSANKNSIHINALKDSLEKYWQNNDFVINYFMFEHLSTMLSSYSDDLENEWNKMPYYNALDAGKLQKLINCHYDSNQWHELKKKISIHKLTYKKSQNTNYTDLYYNYILEDKLI